MPDLAAPTQAAATEPIDPRQTAAVVEIVRGVSRTLRAHLLYEGQNPAIDRQLEALQRVFRWLWTQREEVTLAIEENALLWNGAPVYHAESRIDNLAFLFWKDGLREMSFRPGVEDEEVGRLVTVLARANRLRTDEDDLLTLLWDEDFSSFRYRYTDTGDAVPMLGPESPSTPVAIETTAFRSEPDSPFEALGLEAPDEHQFALDEGELARLREEVAVEMRRDLLADVSAALFDRLEDGTSDRRRVILGIFGELLPGSLVARRFDAAARIVVELARWLRRPDADSEVDVPARVLLDRLAEPDAVRELVRMVEDAPSAVPPEAVSELLALYPQSALRPLLLAVGSTSVPEARALLEPSVRLLAQKHLRHVVALLGDSQPEVAAEAATTLARSGHSASAGRVAELLARPEPMVRLAAIAALQQLRSLAGADALQAALDDGDRDVRISAARALAALRPPGARERLEAALTSKRLRESELPEQIAHFEAYGQLAGAEGVSTLERVLNGRTWLGRRESSDLRACAAAGLARCGPAARAVLEAATADPDPVVRNVAGRALREIRG